MIEHVIGWLVQRPQRLSTLAVLLGLLSVGLLFGQPEEGEPGFRGANSEAPTEGLARQEQTGEQGTTPICELVFCTTDLSKVLVYAGAETAPVHDARSVTMYVDRISQQPKVTCKLYAGVFEPTEPETRTWSVVAVRLVDAAHFQKLVDANEQALKDLIRPKAGRPAVAPVAPEADAPDQPKANVDDSVPLAPRPKLGQPK